MKFRIGFSAEPEQLSEAPSAAPVARRSTQPVRSLVQIHFPDRNMTLSYYNDAFDLRKGDFVFVEGKLEGMRGRVVDVSRSFKIKPSDYKRVIALADTDVRGTFQPAGSHLISFDPNALPISQVHTWFLPPEKEDDTVITCRDGNSFPLAEPSKLGAGSAIVDRGQQYYADNRVSYLSLDGSQGRAIVEGSKPYEVEFTYADGQISDLICPCYCAYPCKHQVAVLLQLQETLDLIGQRYAEQYDRSRCFAAISKSLFFYMAISDREGMRITLDQ